MVQEYTYMFVYLGSANAEKACSQPLGNIFPPTPYPCKLGKTSSAPFKRTTDISRAYLVKQVGLRTLHLVGVTLFLPYILPCLLIREAVLLSRCYSS